jgi:hypothetical protein
MKLKSNWLIIDLDYIFNTYYYKLKSSTKYNLEMDDFISLEFKFINELSKNIKDKIINLITVYKYIPNNNVILVSQSIEKNLNWRNTIDPDYKFKERFENKFQSIEHKIWNQVFDLNLNNFFNEKDYIYFSFLNTDQFQLASIQPKTTSKSVIYNTEISDIISILVKTIQNNFQDDLITVISNNNFLYQLINDKISILDINLTEETHKILPSSEINLWFHIIKGNKERNIKPLLFNLFYLKSFLDTYSTYFNNNDNIDNNIDNNEYQELNKNQLYIILNHLTEFKNLINLDSNSSYKIVKDNLHIINEKLLNFNLIPNDLVLAIEKSFLIKINKNNENYFKSNLKFYKQINKETDDLNETYNKKFNKKIDKDFNKFKSLKNPFSILEIES